MRKIHYLDAIRETTEQMSGEGVFLTTGSKTPNTMTIGWGSVGFYWGKPIFTVVVRPQRHSIEALKREGLFTVSVPKKGELSAELKLAGTNSGRDMDKFTGHGLTAAPAQSLPLFVVAQCPLHFECRVLLAQDMTQDRMDEGVLSRSYPKRDLHTLFLGEIIDCYRTDD